VRDLNHDFKELCRHNRDGSYATQAVPAWADRDDVLVLKDSWNKGGREIRIPIATPEQRQLLDEAKALTKCKSLVAPGYATYRDYLQHFRYECARVGIHAFHGHSPSRRPTT
jgi:hypothetical protein